MKRWLSVLVALNAAVSLAQQGPDLTNTNLNLINTTQSYSLGPTGLRGWIHVAWGSYLVSIPANELMTSFPPYQVLVVSVGTNTPASGVFQYQDVILGVNTRSNNIPVPLFTNDTRKAIGQAIGAAEAGDGWMNFRIWRSGVTRHVSIRLPWHGVAYSATAPYNCPKSALILSNAVNSLTNVIPNSNMGTPGVQVMCLAMLASGCTNFLPRVQTYVRSIPLPPSVESVMAGGIVMWDWGYNDILISEYYLATGDTNVLPQVQAFTLNLAHSTSRYGTAHHSVALPNADGSYNGTCRPYGPVNQVGLADALALVLGRKALQAAGMTVDPAIDAAITRSANFFGWYVQKGQIPYGEHIPGMDHAGAGKDALAALFFALQGNKPVETEYWMRMTLADYPGREFSHTGQGFIYLWSAMGANMAGINAIGAYMANIAWHLDLERRSDGTFVYDGGEQYGTSAVSDYWGNASYFGMDPTACYVLGTYALAQQKLTITGKNMNPSNRLSRAAIRNAMWAAKFDLARSNYNTNQLVAALGEYDPVVRSMAAQEYGARSNADVNAMIALLSSTNAWLRQSACEVLGRMQNTNALTALGERLSDSNIWVRYKAAQAFQNLGDKALSQLPVMLQAFADNATDPNVIDWNDPIQIANGQLCRNIFGSPMDMQNNLAWQTASQPANLLYPALRAALRQPDSNVRCCPGFFLSSAAPKLKTVQDLAPEIIQCALTESQADVMWHAEARSYAIGILSQFYCAETVPTAVSMLVKVPFGFDWHGDVYVNSALNALASFGDSDRWTLPILDKFPAGSDKLLSTIAAIRAATNSPSNITNLFPVADSQVVATTNVAAILLTGKSCRASIVTFTNVTAPAHGLLTGKAPILTYTPTPGYSGVDRFTFQVVDSMTNSDPATVSIIVGKEGTGWQGQYYDSMDFTNLKFRRTDPQINFDWGAGAPTSTMRSDTFSVRWRGFLLAPEDGTYIFSTFSGGGVRLFVGGVSVIDDWYSQGRHWTDGAGIRLARGKRYLVQMDFRKDTGDAVAKLKWTGPSFAAPNGVLVGSQWVYASLGMAKAPVYAYPQSVTMVKNTQQAITLEGSPSVTCYQIVTGPAHGSLSGTAPAVIYTPDAGYQGMDRFTFTGSDNVTTSPAATVSITVLAGHPLAFDWTNERGGAWSAAGNWKDGTGAPTAPARTGQPYYNLNFNTPGAYTADNDLESGFKVNQMNFAASVIIGGNAITCANNGPVLPRISQNSSAAIAFNTPLVLATNTTFGGPGSGNLTVNGSISGPGSLTINTPGVFTVNSISNTYSGGTVQNAGTLLLLYAGGSAYFPFGSGPLTLNGTLVVSRGNLPNTMILNGACIQNINGFGSGFSGPVTLNGTNTIDTTANGAGAINMTGNISGSGGILAKGQSAFVVSGTNTYAGPTRIESGSVHFNNALSVAPGTLVIEPSAKAVLYYAGTQTISGLTLAGENQPAGTYGSTNSAATYRSAYFDNAGTGMVTVATGGGSISNVR